MNASNDLPNLLQYNCMQKFVQNVLVHSQIYRIQDCMNVCLYASISHLAITACNGMNEEDHAHLRMPLADKNLFQLHS